MIDQAAIGKLPNCFDMAANPEKIILFGSSPETRPIAGSDVNCSLSNQFVSDAATGA